MNFSTEASNINRMIYNGVLDSSTIEYKMFKYNLKVLIDQNKEKGHIPEETPPDHLLHKPKRDDDHNQAKLDPLFISKSTESVMNKRIKRKQQVYSVVKENNNKFLVKVDDKRKVKVDEGVSLLECATNCQLD